MWSKYLGVGLKSDFMNLGISCCFLVTMLTSYRWSAGYSYSAESMAALARKPYECCAYFLSCLEGTFIKVALDWVTSRLGLEVEPSIIIIKIL